MRTVRLFCIGLSLGILLGAPAVFAEDEKTLGWKDDAEFSLVATEGNSESLSLGFKNTLERTWETSSLNVRLGAIRIETTGNKSAVNGVVMDGVSEITAESYFANGRYDHNFSERFFWYAGAGWLRNEPSGIENRYIAEAGVGNLWIDTEDVRFKTTYGVTYTDQEDVVRDPRVEESYAGLRLAWDYSNQFSKSTKYTNVLVLDENLDETKDWRAYMDNGLTSAMSERLALKVGLQFLYDHLPALELIPNVDGAGNALAPVPAELDELDTILTISLVVNVK